MEGKRPTVVFFFSSLSPLMRINRRRAIKGSNWSSISQREHIRRGLNALPLTQRGGTAEWVWARWASTRPGWRCRWFPGWPTARHSSRCSPARGSVGGCSRRGWSGRPWGAPGWRGHCSCPPGEKKEEFQKLEPWAIMLLRQFCVRQIFLQGSAAFLQDSRSASLRTLCTPDIKYGAQCQSIQVTPTPPWLPPAHTHTLSYLSMVICWVCVCLCMYSLMS